MWWLLLTGVSGAAAPTTIDLDEVWREDPGSNNAYFGWSVASAGDVNADGFSDIVVGAMGHNGAFSNEGRAYVYLGSPTGPLRTAAWIEDGGRADAWFGNSVASAGDVNADGYDDVVIGAYSDLPGGSARVFLGSATGLALFPVWTETQPSPPEGFGSFGYVVSSAGDVNGDGFDDLLIGDPHVGGAGDQGKAYVYLGSATGPAGSPVWTADGPEEDSGFGHVLASAGDVNADGYDDIILGAWWTTIAYVFLGSPSGPATSASWTVDFGPPGLRALSVASAGDVDSDGYDDVIVGVPYEQAALTYGRVYLFLGSASGLRGTAAWTVDAEVDTVEFGWSLASAGDVDRDGYDDVVIGAGEQGWGGPVRDRLVLYRGSPTGLADTPAWTLTTGGTRASLGMSVASAGDTNGDGYDDVIAGAPYFEHAGVPSGQAAVYRGACVAEPDTDADGVGDVCDHCVGSDDRFDADADGIPDGCDGCPGGVDLPDLDRDGFCAEVDCDDHDPSVFPGAPEVCNGWDDDCDGLTPTDETDDDLDRVFACAGDCDDHDAFTYPGAPQRCDRVDNTCAGVLHSSEIDADNDGYWGCAGDCDDEDPEVNLSKDEVCGNEVDDNCDGHVDEACGCSGCAGAAAPVAPGVVAFVALLAGTRRRRQF